MLNTLFKSGFHCVPGFTHHFKQWSIDNEQKHKSRGGLVNVPGSGNVHFNAPRK